MEVLIRDYPMFFPTAIGIAAVYFTVPVVAKIIKIRKARRSARP